MADIVRDTFTETGDSAVCTGRFIGIQINFASTGSVDIKELQADGNYITAGEAVTSDYINTYGHPDGPVRSIKLTATDATGNIWYEMKAAH
jgi:hypothetical protein